MAQDSSSGNSGTKWFIGILISLLAAGGGIVALLNYFNPAPQSGSAPSASPTAESRLTMVPTPTTASVTPQRICKIEGAVYNDDTESKTPIPNVRINVIQNQKNDSTYLTTTRPDGQFKGDCSHLDSGEFPLTLVLSSPHWRGITSRTEEKVLETGRDNINIYVSLNEINKGFVRSIIRRIPTQSVIQR